MPESRSNYTVIQSVHNNLIHHVRYISPQRTNFPLGQTTTATQSKTTTFTSAGDFSLFLAHLHIVTYTQLQDQREQWKTRITSRNACEHMRE